MSRIIRMLTAATAAGGLALVVLAAGVLAAPLASAAPAGAAALPLPAKSDIWAGYYALPPVHQQVRGVSANMHVPPVDCATGVGRKNGPFAAAFWVGIGGEPDPSDPKYVMGLEQMGIDVTCASRTAQPVYWPFSEMIKKDNTGPPEWFMIPGTQDHVPVNAGDIINMTVYAPSLSQQKGKYEFDLNIGPGGQGAGVWQAFAAIDPSTVTGKTGEVITELPNYPAKLVPGSTVTTGLAGLANFGTATYDGATFWSGPGTRTGAMPPGYAVTQHKMTMIRPGSDSLPIVRVSTSKPFTPPGQMTNTSFSNKFTGKW